MLDVHLLVGPLGSGKSTLLQQLIAHPQFPRQQTALLINDAGPLNIDARLFRNKASAVSALTGGCACCSTSQELAQELLKFAAQPHLTQAWIEASGAASTEDLLDRLTDSLLLRHTRLVSIWQVIDASRYPRTWLARNALLDSVSQATVIILNKVDLVESKTRQAIEKEVRRANSSAPLYLTTRARLTSALPDADPTLSDRLALWLPNRASPKDHHVASCFIPMPEPVDCKRLLKRLTRLPKGVTRVKGFLRFTDTPQALHVVHQVGRQQEALLWEYANSDASDPPPLGLVLLGNPLDPQALHTFLTAS